MHSSVPSFCIGKLHHIPELRVWKLQFRDQISSTPPNPLFKPSQNLLNTYHSVFWLYRDRRAINWKSRQGSKYQDRISGHFTVVIEIAVRGFIVSNSLPLRQGIRKYMPWNLKSLTKRQRIQTSARWAEVLDEELLELVIGKTETSPSNIANGSRDSATRSQVAIGRDRVVILGR